MHGGNTPNHRTHEIRRTGKDIKRPTERRHKTKYEILGTGKHKLNVVHRNPNVHKKYIYIDDTVDFVVGLNNILEFINVPS